VAQPEFPEMLTLKMLAGARDALKDQSSILLTQSLAKSLFGDQNPMNKIVRPDNKLNMKVAWSL